MRFEGRTRKKISFEEEPEEIFRQNGYLESVVSSMKDALIVLNPDATLKSVNKSTLDLLGYRENELIGQPVKQLFLQEEESMVHRYFQRIVTAGVAYNNIGLTFLAKQGKAIPVNFSGAVLQQGGKILGIVGVARDMRQIMTIINALEKKEGELEERNINFAKMQRAMLHMMGDLDIAKKEMEKANKELRKLDQLKSDLISTVSHELRTPLTVTREAISQVLDEIFGEINTEQKEFLFMAVEGIDRLSRLIENLLDISKIEANRIELKRQWIDIVSLVKEVGSSLASSFQSKGLEIKYNFPEDKIEAYLDKDKVVQIFLNLLNNALKFTSDGYVEITIANKENVVECVVFDTGIGISDEDLPKIFSKFEQFGRQFESAEKGTGLGLAISKGLIELHRGNIRVESKLGQGTKVILSLPKFSPRDLFKDYVHRGLTEVMTHGRSLSIVFFEVKNYDTLRQKLGQDKIVSLMNNLGQLIKNDLRIKSDICINNSQEILVALPDTDRESAWSIAKRLREKFDNYLSRERLDNEVEVEFGALIFPEDAAAEDEFLRLAKLK